MLIKQDFYAITNINLNNHDFKKQRRPLTMSRKEKVVFGLINIILFILVIVFLNDGVISATSDKVAPLLAVLLFINLIIALNKGKGGENQL